jgi:nucleobase:cation symporter-1, NCS1 family
MGPSWLRWAELPARTDIHQDKGTTEWGNHDLYPIVEKERTYGIGAYLLFWVTCGGGLSTLAIGSSYATLGLTAGQTCGAVLTGASLSSLNAILVGKAGAVHHLGFVSIFSRPSRIETDDYRLCRRVSRLDFANGIFH